MSQSSSPQFTERTARVIHSALFAGVFAIFAVLVAATKLATLPENLPAALRYVGFVQLIVIGIVIYRMRARVPMFGEGDDRDSWWAVNAQRVIVMWILAGGAGRRRLHVPRVQLYAIYPVCVFPLTPR